MMRVVPKLYAGSVVYQLQCKRWFWWVDVNGAYYGTKEKAVHIMKLLLEDPTYCDSPSPIGFLK
jgi:hypothetical protein